MYTTAEGDVEKVIKGVNKQIIEIKCTNNELFDRAILFVNSDCDMFSLTKNTAAAREYISGLTDQITDDKNDPFYKKDRMTVVLAVLLGVLLFLAVFFTVIFSIG